MLAGMSSLLHECWHPISSPHCGEVCSAAPARSLVYNEAGSFVFLLLLRVTYFVVFQDQICQTVTLLNVLLRHCNCSLLDSTYVSCVLKTQFC